MSHLSFTLPFIVAVLVQLWLSSFSPSY